MVKVVHVEPEPIVKHAPRHEVIVQRMPVEVIRETRVEPAETRVIREPLAESHLRYSNVRYEEPVRQSNVVRYEEPIRQSNVVRYEEPVRYSNQVIVKEQPSVRYENINQSHVTQYETGVRREVGNPVHSTSMGQSRTYYVKDGQRYEHYPN